MSGSYSYQNELPIEPDGGYSVGIDHEAATVYTGDTNAITSASRGTETVPNPPTGSHSRVPADSNFQPRTESFGSIRTVERGCFLWFHYIFSILVVVSMSFSIVVNCSCLLASLIYLVQPFQTTSLIIRVYLIALLVLAVFCELNWTESIRTTPLLQSWFMRGLFYAFLGFMTIHEYLELFYTTKLKIAVASSGYVVIAIGCVYSIMVRTCPSCFCLILVVWCSAHSTILALRSDLK